MSDVARTNAVEWTVSELSAALKKTVEDAYGFVRVRGEVSGFKGAAPSGHCYFRLKDDKAVIEAVIWKGSFARMRLKPEEGLDVALLRTVPGDRGAPLRPDGSHTAAECGQLGPLAKRGNRAIHSRARLTTHTA